MEAHDEELGPIDIVVIAYPADAPMTGEAVPIMLDLVDRGIIRVLDVLFVVKEADGTFAGFQATDLDERQTSAISRVRGRVVRAARRRRRGHGRGRHRAGLGGGHDRLREPLGRPVRRCRSSQRRQARRLPADPDQELIASLDAAEAAA